MHIAIDDTFGPKKETSSQFVTGNRRTHVAVVFPDITVESIRIQIGACLEEIERLFNIRPTEFHFVDIYNRQSPWDLLPGQANLGIFEAFASIYRQYRWSVYIQTIDDRTLSDHGIKELAGQIEGFDLSNRSHLSLILLLFKIKKDLRHKLRHKNLSEPITIYVDEGIRKAGTAISPNILRDWSEQFEAVFASSKDEPLVQLSDFVAFCINRTTHLSMKDERTKTDQWFLELVHSMKIDCDDFHITYLQDNFSVSDFDEVHRVDRRNKGL